MPRWIRLFHRFADQPANRRWLLLEACLYLVWARLLLLALPFRRLVPLLDRRSSCAAMPDSAARRQLRQDIGWALERASAHLPGQITCFPRGIAAQAMCRRRGMDVILYYGAATLPERGLSAHVWVLDDTEGVTGHQFADDYRILSRFPR